MTTKSRRVTSVAGSRLSNSDGHSGSGPEGVLAPGRTQFGMRRRKYR